MKITKIFIFLLIISLVSCSIEESPKKNKTKSNSSSSSEDYGNIDIFKNEVLFSSGEKIQFNDTLKDKTSLIRMKVVNNKSSSVSFSVSITGDSCFSYINGSRSYQFSLDSKTFTVLDVQFLPRSSGVFTGSFQFAAGGESFVYPMNGSCSDGSAIVDNYYKSAEGKSGSYLKNELNSIINKNVVRLSYSQCWDAIKYSDEDPANSNNVILIYTGWSIPKSKNGTDNDGWNREHVWAKSHGDFGTDTGAGTDIHHLRACDVTVNSSRNNNDFDNGGTAYTDSTPYGSYSGVTGCRRNGSLSWEPRDEDKGDVARMIFYMAVMYEGKGGYDKVDLELTESVGNESAPLIGRLAALKTWHENDPVSDLERRRNERIYEKQGNRNPFIDKPEFVDLIW